MPIFVSEPGRPIETRIPEAFRSSRVDAMDKSTESHALNTQRHDESDASYLNAQQAAARRAFSEYSEHMDSGPEAERAYLPVSRLYTPSLFTLPATASMKEALAEMGEHGIHHLVILAEGAVAGLIDLSWTLTWLHDSQKNAADQSFTNIELPSFLTATLETDAHQLARLMLAHRLDAALVMDHNGAPEGIVTVTDYLRLYANVSRKEGSV
ncbi:CBS domain-containing protein [Marinobacter caseinilyticus]|uniref:CBS domain-containing protein n=1 Tax=Marinobacter caseinilyticus TaxID=2692195 RepID=UPI00140D7432|nr:CBS domain-containing protein [Marinobacter caseinilyticus]